MTEPSTQTDLPLADNGTTPSARKTTIVTSGVRRLVIVPLIFLTLFTGGVLGLYFQPPGLQAFFNIFDLSPGGGTETPIAVAIQQVADEETLALVSEGDVVALGRIIPKGDVITVSPPFGSGDARIAELNVAEGESVVAGDIVATLDSLAQLESIVRTSRANVQVTEASLRQTREQTRASLAEAKAELLRAEATESAAAADLSRTTALLERGVTTRATFDSTVARATEASRDVERARATLSRFETQNGEKQADVALAVANLEAARAQLIQAETDLEKAVVRAPITGTVLDINVRPGERPGDEGILELGDISQMTVEAEVYETLIGRVTIGDPVLITADALPEDLSGSVTAIGLEIGRQSITSDDPAANTDARVVDVIITLDEASSKSAERLTNLQVVVRIDAGRQDG